MEREHIKKLILIGICVVIFLLLIIRNAFGCAGGSSPDNAENSDNMTEDSNLFGNADDKQGAEDGSDVNDEATVKIEGIKKTKAAYMMSFFIEGGIKLPDTVDNTVTGERLLTCGDLKEYLKILANENIIEYKEVLQVFPDRLLEQERKATDIVGYDEFLKIFDYLAGLEGGPEKKSINVIRADIDKDITLYGDDGTGYIIPESEAAEVPDRSIGNTEEVADKGIENTGKVDYAALAFDTVEAYSCNGSILHIAGITEGSFVIPNAWIIDGSDYAIQAFINGVECSINTMYKLPNETSSENIKRKIADIYIDKQKVKSLTVKPEAVNGKVMLVDEEGIEIEGHGKLELDENFRIYKVYDELAMETTPGILIGYTITDFVIAGEKICAALINEPLKAANIRVVIGNTSRDKLIHDRVELTVNRAYKVMYADEAEEYKAGELLTILPEDERLKKGRITIVPESDNARTKLFSVGRSYGDPEYRGIVEISKKNDGLVIVNELSLEEYLYSVVPSEMPVSYGTEALMVQAVCARSYAYNQLMANRYSSYGAHVDDSVNCQVYNNVRETDETIRAVKNTYGQIMESDGKIVSAFYFSTSCGTTSNVEDVWPGNASTEYFRGGLQVDRSGDYAVFADEYDYSSEEDFRGFIDSRTLKTFDSGYSWYRWTVEIPEENLTKTVNDAIAARYNAGPAYVLTRNSNGEFVSRSIKSIGTVKNIEITERARSGLIKELQITGSEAVVRIKYQTNIRTLFAPLYNEVVRANSSAVSDMKLLPSAYFYIDTAASGDGKTFIFRGGGYGHGVGMSQNGVKTMASLGYDCEEILKHYYNGIEIGFLYD